MKWTNEKPTKPGAYFWRIKKGGEPVLANVTQKPNANYLEPWPCFWGFLPVDGIPGQWSDQPIPMPEEPAHDP